MNPLNTIGRLLRKGLVRRPTVDFEEGRYWSATVTPDDKARRYYSYNPDQASLLMRAAGYVNICASMNAMYFASVPIRLYCSAKSAEGVGKGPQSLKMKRVHDRRQKAWMRSRLLGKAATYADNAEDAMEVQDAAPLALLSNPNYDDTGIEERRLSQYFREICGNSYWQHDATTALLPRNLLNLYPQWTMPRVGDNGVEGYRYGRNQTNQIDIDAENVIHFVHMPSPQNPWQGVGCLNGVAVEADIYASAIVYEQSFWNNGARPDFMVLLPKGSTDDQVKQAEARLQRRHQGARKGGTPIVGVGDDMDIKPLQWSPKEMEYGDGIDRMRRTICNAFGVPLAMLEMNDTAVLGSGTQMFAARTQYLSQTILPRCSSYCERLTESYLPLFGMEPGEFWFAPDNPVPEDQKMLEESAVALYGGDVITKNEARAMIWFEPATDGDKFKSESQPLSPFGLGGFGGFGGGSGADADAGGVPLPRGGVVTIGAEPTQAVKALPVYQRLDVVTGRGGCNHNHGTKAALVKTDQYAPTIAEACRRYYEAIRGEVSVRGSELLFDPKRAADVFVREVSPALLRAFGAGFDEATVDLRYRLEARKDLRERIATKDDRLVGSTTAGGNDPITEFLRSFAIDNRAAREFVSDYMPRLARTVTATVRDELRAALTAHIDSGGSPQRLAAVIQERITGLSRDGAERIARTESARAFVTGNIEAWKDSGVVVGKKWLVSSDACAFCKAAAADFNNKSIPLGANFYDKGTVLEVGGKTMVLDYDAVNGPPLHPQCECDVLPVLEGEE